MHKRNYLKTGAAKYQCSLFPWLKARHWHHTNYTRYDHEILWIDLVPVSVVGHWVIHGVLGGSITMPKAVTRQNRTARALPLTRVWQYPNPAQRLTHLWCRIPRIGKLLLTLILIYSLTYGKI